MKAVIPAKEWNTKIVPMAKYLSNYNKDSGKKFGLCLQTVDEKLWASFATGHMVFRQRIFTLSMESGIDLFGLPNPNSLVKSQEGRFVEIDSCKMKLNETEYRLVSSVDKDANPMLGGYAFWSGGSEGLVIASYDSIKTFNRKREEAKTCKIGLNFTELCDIGKLVPSKGLYVRFKTYKTSDPSCFQYEGRIIPTKAEDIEANLFITGLREQKD